METDPKLGKLAVDRYDASLTARKDDSYGKVQLRGTDNVDDLVNYMKSKGTEISKSTLRASIDLYEEAKTERLLDGFSINTPTVRMYPTCQGVFVGERPMFQRPQNRILVKCTQGDYLRKRCEEVDVIVNPMAITGPCINEVIDSFTGEVNGSLTAGKTIICKGSNISVVGENAEVGFYLIKLGDPETRTKIDMRDVVENRPSQLRIQLPAVLADGNYQVEVVTQLGSNSKNPTKEPRSYRFEQILTVGAGSGGSEEGGGDDVLG